MTEQELGHRGRLFRCLFLMPICAEPLLQILQEIDDGDEWNSFPSHARQRILPESGGFSTRSS